MKHKITAIIASTVIGASAFLVPATIATAETNVDVVCSKTVTKMVRVGNKIKIIRIVTPGENCLPNKPNPPGRKVVPIPGPLLNKVAPNTAKLSVCGTVKVGQFFKIIECNPNA